MMMHRLLVMMPTLFMKFHYSISLHVHVYLCHSACVELTTDRDLGARHTCIIYYANSQTINNYFKPILGELEFIEEAMLCLLAPL